MRPEQADVSIKNLLKQVYAAHTAKVKCLEDEIEELKKNLVEAEKKLKEKASDCKRCAELEEAFTACKAALEEQNKWFENFGQKFSIFNNSENKVSLKTSKLQDDIVQIYNENSVGSDIPQSNQTNEKSSITKKTLLRNLMCLTPDKVQDSLDLCTAAFPGNLGPSCSSLNFDSVILAPDTADITFDVQNNAFKPCRTKPKVLKSSEQLNDTANKSEDCTDKIKSRKKRMCSNSSESEKSPNKKLNKGPGNNSPVKKKTVESKIESEKSPDKKLNKGPGNNSPVKKKTVESKIVTKKESILEERVKLDLGKSSNPKILNDETIEFFDLKTKNNNTPIDTDNKGKMVSPFNSEINRVTNIEEPITIPSIEKEKNCQTKLEHAIKKDSMYQISPSLLSLNKKNEKNILQNQPTLDEDISDFQIPSISKNPPEMVDAWKTSDKKKTKKAPGIKNIKSTSKFKMSLDALPSNYKKPNLRQTKLSKSIFQPKNSTPEDGFSNEAKKILSDSSNSSAELSTKNSPVKKSNKINSIDFDATCIPENFKFNAESCDDEESILLIPDESSDESLHSPTVSPKSKMKSQIKEDASKENKKKDKFEDFLSKKQVNSENLNSFDRLPKREEPNYKYKEETVRKKSERKQLMGFECKECEKYFSDLGLSEEEKRERLNKCSRHRGKFAPPATPEHFWELDFPDTQECKARGYLNETQKGTLKTHRRRPL